MLNFFEKILKVLFLILRKSVEMLTFGSWASGCVCASMTSVQVQWTGCLFHRIYTGRAAVPTAARRGSRTGWCWSGCCWRLLAGIRRWVTARASTCWRLWFWRSQRAARATLWRYEDAENPESDKLFDVFVV